MEMDGVMNTSGDLPFSTASHSTVVGLADHTLDNATAIASVRTGCGLAPKYLEDVIGRRLDIAVAACSLVTNDPLEKP